MSNGWKEVELRDIVRSISEKHKFNINKIILINTSDILKGKVLNHTYVENKNLRGQFKKSFRKGDILYSEIRPKNRRFAYIDFDSQDYIASTKLMVLRKSNEKINTNFLFQILKSDNVINRLQILAETRSGTFPQITYDILARLKINLPTLKEQKTISAILSSLDDKIENNHKICEKLEEIAQVIFKQWFIDFEFPNEDGKPYKSSAGEMEYCEELGKDVPEGWNQDTFEEIGTIVGGSTPLKKREDYYKYGVIPWITPKDLSKYKGMFISKGDNFITKAGYNSCSAKLLGKGSILFTSRAPIGYIAIAAKEVCTNQGFKSIIPNKGYGTEFVYELMKQLTPQIINAGSGSTFKEISGSSMKRIKTLLPSKKIAKKYCRKFKYIFEMIYKKEAEVLILQKTRDALLPKLMNDEINVESIEI